jgi:hypothetical protein
MGNYFLNKAINKSNKETRKLIKNDCLLNIRQRFAMIITNKKIEISKA